MLNDNKLETISKRNLYISSFFGGAVGGLVVDLVLYPLDTVKTRLQAEQGFKKCGGFKGIYKGIGVQAVGSAPQAALFFITYESFKYAVEPLISSKYHAAIYMTGASISEIVACLVRVPMEVIKQRRQVSRQSTIKIFFETIKTEGFRKGLYRGYGSTILREVPFSVIQFPILEYLKKTYRIQFKNNIPLESWEVAVCGATAGGVAAALTTPLDVAKTRIMLADVKNVESITVRHMLRHIYQNQGIKGLFAGFTPRVVWITLGGYIFFGMYDFAKKFCNDYILDSDLYYQ